MWLTDRTEKWLSANGFIAHEELDTNSGLHSFVAIAPRFGSSPAPGDRIRRHSVRIGWRVHRFTVRSSQLDQYIGPDDCIGYEEIICESIEDAVAVAGGWGCPPDRLVPTTENNYPL
jgi:hypothetical protein